MNVPFPATIRAETPDDALVRGCGVRRGGLVVDGFTHGEAQTRGMPVVGADGEGDDMRCGAVWNVRVE